MAIINTSSFKSLQALQNLTFQLNCVKDINFEYKSVTFVGAFFGGTGLPPAVMGWAASCDDRPQYF